MTDVAQVYRGVRDIEILHNIHVAYSGNVVWRLLYDGDRGAVIIQAQRWLGGHLVISRKEITPTLLDVVADHPVYRCWGKSCDGIDLLHC